MSPLPPSSRRSPRRDPGVLAGTHAPAHVDEQRTEPAERTSDMSVAAREVVRLPVTYLLSALSTFSALQGLASISQRLNVWPSVSPTEEREQVYFTSLAFSSDMKTSP